MKDKPAKATVATNMTAQTACEGLGSRSVSRQENDTPNTNLNRE